MILLFMFLGFSMLQLAVAEDYDETLESRGTAPALIYVAEARDSNDDTASPILRDVSSCAVPDVRLRVFAFAPPFCSSTSRSKLNDGHNIYKTHLTLLI